MKTFSFVVLIFLAVLLSACSGTLAPIEKEFTIPNAGEVALSLRAKAPGTAWNRAGAEAATVSVHVDGDYKADVVLFRGETSFTYEILLGELTQGKHRLAIYREPSKSAGQSEQVRIEDVSLRVLPREDPLYLAMAHAPILYGRDDSRVSDTPLLMYHEIARTQNTTTIQYTIIFSNEDGGTAPDGLMARWGRLTDIEWVYRVTLDAQGAVLKEEYQDKDHNTALFHGTKDAQHPFLKNVTRNNLFSDAGTSSYRFALVPTESLPDASREEIMDRNPWTYLVMAQEWEREKQPSTELDGIPETRAVSDPRNYLYIEFRSEPLSNPSCDAKLAIQTKLDNNDRWYSSDHGVDSLQIVSQGWRRSAIELPPSTTASHIDELRFLVFPGKNFANCGVVITDIRKAFLLDQSYAPQKSLLTWRGRQVLDSDDTTSDPSNFILHTGIEITTSIPTSLLHLSGPLRVRQQHANHWWKKYK